jgi:hypothetical protein
MGKNYYAKKRSKPQAASFKQQAASATKRTQLNDIK